MSSGAQTLIAELDESLKNRSDAERFTILRRVTELFLQGAASYSAEQVRIFDDVMMRLLGSSTRDALVELSGKRQRSTTRPSTSSAGWRAMTRR